jgi:hypothetical protein
MHTKRSGALPLGSTVLLQEDKLKKKVLVVRSITHQCKKESSLLRAC